MDEETRELRAQLLLYKEICFDNPTNQRQIESILNSLGKYTWLLQLNQQQVIRLIHLLKIQKVNWGNEEKNILCFLLRRQLIQLFCKSQRKRQQRLYISQIVKAKGKMIFAAPEKKKARICLYDLNTRKLIRQFFNFKYAQDGQAIYRASQLVGNKLFVYQIEKLIFYKYAHIQCYDIVTGLRIITRAHQNQMMKFSKQSKFGFNISNDGKLFAFKSDQKITLFSGNFQLIAQYKLREKNTFKFSECQQYLMQYSDSDSSQNISVIDIMNKSERQYEIEFQLYFVKLIDRILHTVQRKNDKMIYIKIKL